jgi:hypothetical protein
MPKIFESPDGGKTVFSREFGQHDQEFEWEDPSASKVKKILKDRQEWDNIINAATENPALQEAIDRVKLIYHLSKKNGKE